MKIYSLLLLVMLINLASCKSNQTNKIKTNVNPPNILFIISDDLGYKDLSITGSEYYETPNIDNIAKNSLQFKQGYATCQVCSPSRASIMTGKFTARHGITDWIGALEDTAWRKKERFNQLLPAFYEHKMDTSNITLAEALKEKGGYSTFFAGKWHIGNQGSLPEDHGFDYNVGGFHAGSPNGGYFSPYKNPKLSNGPKGENLSMRLASETSSFIKNHIQNNKEKPFFAFLSFYAVHGPIQTTSAKWDKYRNKATEKGVEEKGYAMGKYLPIRQHQDNPIYGGLVESMDDAVGHVLQTLDSLKLSENTIIVFTSDNGGVCSGDSFSTSNLPLKGGKGYQYEGGIRVPFFIRVPWMENTHGESNTIAVTGADFFPTLLELSGNELLPEQHEDGVSLVPLLEGKKEYLNRSLVWHYPHYGNQGGEPSSLIRKGDWKLIHYYENGKQELYNLSKDPYEKSNLTEEYPTIRKRLNDHLFTYLHEVGANFPKKDPLYDKKKEKEYLRNIERVKMPSLEKNRLLLLDPTFNPNNEWWGSGYTVD